MAEPEHDGPSRRATLAVPRPRRGMRPWFKVRFSREKFVDFARSMIWVAPLTVVIWIYAEREQIVPLTVADVPVRVFSSDAKWSVQVVKENGAMLPSVNLELRGPLDGLQRVQNTLTSHIPQGVQIDLGGSLTVTDAQPQPINVANHIQNQPLFRSSGVTVESVPPIVLVNIDEMIDVTADVQMPPDLPTVDSATTTFEPRQVQVRGPRKLLQQMGGHPTVYADVGRLVERLKPGVHKLDDVPVVVADSSWADRIAVQPPTNKVNVQLTIMAADETRTIPSMPVLLQAPSRLLQGYDVHWDEAVANVDVSGPPDRLNQLDANPPRAVLNLSMDDAGHEGEKGLTYILPEGVQASPASAGKTVKFQMTPRGG